MTGPAGHAQVDPVQHVDAVVAAADAAHLEQGHALRHHGWSVRVRGGHALRRAAEVGLAHGVVGLDLGRRPRGEQLPEVEDVDAEMLDHEAARRARPVPRRCPRPRARAAARRTARSRTGCPGGGLVEQQHRWIAGQRPGQLDEAGPGRWALVVTRRSASSAEPTRSTASSTWAPGRPSTATNPGGCRRPPGCCRARESMVKQLEALEGAAQTAAGPLRSGRAG